MPYTISYDSQNKCIIAKMEGEINLETIKEFANKITQEVEKYNCNKILNDIRNINLKISLADIYSLPKVVSEAGLRLSCKRAIIVSSDLNDASFFETVSVNRSQYVKIFKKQADALKWLQDD